MKGIHNEILMNIPDEKVPSFSIFGVERCSYCMDSGKLYSPSCMYDTRGTRQQTGYFIKGTEPSGLCDRHIACKYDCLTDGVATHGCPEEYLSTVSLIKVEDRSFPVEIIITDAEYVYRKIDGSHPLGDRPDMPYFCYYIDEEIFVGRSGKKKQFNSACYLHND